MKKYRKLILTVLCVVVSFFLSKLVANAREQYYTVPQNVNDFDPSKEADAIEEAVNRNAVISCTANDNVIDIDRLFLKSGVRPRLRLTDTWLN